MQSIHSTSRALDGTLHDDDGDIGVKAAGVEGLDMGSSDIRNLSSPDCTPGFVPQWRARAYIEIQSTEDIESLTGR
jgi:hypothetical protein